VTPTITSSITPTTTPTNSVTPTITSSITPTPTPTPTTGCLTCQTYEITLESFNNCGEYFTYTDCYTQNTVYVGTGTSVNSWFTSPFGSNPLTICSCDVPDITYFTGCTASINGPINNCPTDDCQCYTVTIDEQDNPFSNPIYLNVRQCGGTYETLIFNSTGNFNYCFAEVYSLYQLPGGIISGVTFSTVSVPNGPCSSKNDCG
jgi:hypothetical protein